MKKGVRTEQKDLEALPACQHRMGPQPCQPPILTNYYCSICQYQTYDAANINKHVKQTACIDAQVVKKRIYVLTYTDVASVAAGGAQYVSEPCSANNIRGNNNIINSNNVNIHINIHPEALPSRSAQEAQAIVQHILDNRETLEEALDDGDALSLLSRIFKFTKGVEGPPELRNMFVRGNDVYEKREGGTTRTPLKRCLNAWTLRMFDMCKDILLQAPDKLDLTEEQQEEIVRMFEALFEPDRGQRYSVEDVARMMVSDPRVVKRVSESLRAAELECKENLLRELERLRKRRMKQ